MRSKLILIALLFSTLPAFAAKAFKCTIKGVIVNRDSKTLILKKTTDDEKGNLQLIPIYNNTFEFTFEVKETEAYELIFKDELDKGAWYSIVFFPVEGKVMFKLYSADQQGKDEITGGELNKNYAVYKLEEAATFGNMQNAINNEVRLLSENKEYYSHERDSLVNIMMHTSHEKVDRSVYINLGKLDQSGEGYTPKGKVLRKKMDSLGVKKQTWRYNYINNNHNLLSYYFMLADINRVKNDPDLLRKIQNTYPEYANRYPSHPYTQILKSVLAGFNKIKPDETVIDVSLPDIDGRIHNLGEFSQGKITLIDFWGSWCGPCIAATRTMLPVYQKFKDKGFVIVGIAKEYKNTGRLKIVLSREKYPWINLVELNDENGIWNKFGITNSTGMMLLIDKQGKIIAIDPTADEVKKVLSANL